MKNQIQKSILIAIFITLGGLSNCANAQQLVKDLRPGGYNSSPRQFISVGTTMFFIADTSITGNNPALWKTDGTANGTVRVFGKILRASGSGDGMASLNGYLYFVAYDPNLGFELWKSDGTESGTVMVKDIASNNLSSNPTNLIIMNGMLYFMAKRDGIDDRELWKSDGTEAGTVMVKDILPGIYGQTTNYENMVVVNGMLYFSARIATNGREQLWKSDGTEVGTVMVKDPAGYSIRNLNEFNGNLYFSGNDGVNGEELWKSDGTNAGTMMLKDINPGISDSYIKSKMTVFNGNLYFIAKTSANGVELWKTDGTFTNTVLLKDIRPGTLDGINYFSPFKQANGSLYFTANDGINGFELWKTDGTESETVMVKDLKPGSNGSFSPLDLNPKDFETVGNVLYFSADNGTYGYELWKSDGTDAGTSLVKDIQTPGITISASSDPGGLYNHNDILFFTADDGVFGRELWALNTTVGIKDLNTNASMRIYPNPCSEQLFIELSDYTNTTAEILNTKGQVMQSIFLQSISTTIQINNLPSGLYFVHVNSPEGIIVQKLVKN